MPSLLSIDRCGALLLPQPYCLRSASFPSVADSSRSRQSPPEMRSELTSRGASPWIGKQVFLSDRNWGKSRNWKTRPERIRGVVFDENTFACLPFYIGREKKMRSKRERRLESGNGARFGWRCHSCHVETIR
ncbi:hypothetical protein HPP92_014203 [Vanilla planifolia]|uniref:Uncharacterized protein n=1 Tax=Vanilla planifolia TaxID=51239 RepID=A0A835UUJ0_VANPL|nr:hypothetical protein HPP92_014203 [Vanilla planifolia]